MQKVNRRSFVKVFAVDNRSNETVGKPLILEGLTGTEISCSKFYWVTPTQRKISRFQQRLQLMI